MTTQAEVQALRNNWAEAGDLFSKAAAAYDAAAAATEDASVRFFLCTGPPNSGAGAGGVSP